MIRFYHERMNNDDEVLLNTLIHRGLVPYDHGSFIHSDRNKDAPFMNYLQQTYQIDPWVCAEIMAEHKGYAYHRWDMKQFDLSVMTRVAIQILKEQSCLPIQQQGDQLNVMISKEDSLELRYHLKEYFPECSTHQLYLVPQEFLEDAWSKLPKNTHDFLKHLDHLNRWATGHPLNVDDIPTDYILQIILDDAYAQRASDIHFEPHEHQVHLRFRIDGILKKYRDFPYEYWGILSGRIKVLSGMNTAENRRPQNGRFTQRLRGHDVDIRAASMATTQGEAMVLRLLDKHKVVLPLDQLGFHQKFMTLLTKLYSVPQGLILFTGPTGSGKTTTLYSILHQLNQGDKNIMTLEDPVEYDLAGIRQTSIQDDILNFQDGIKAMLRQDPDIILIGEIRDEDTAKMAFRASQTGHLVLSTLHTHDVWGVFPRLMDLGISFETLQHTVTGIVSQRLIRKRCKCVSVGCTLCEGTRLHGRLAIAELLWITSEVRSYLHPQSLTNIPESVLEKYYISLKESALDAIHTDKTTYDEVKRYLGEFE